MADCRPFHSSLSAFIDDDLPAGERAALETHLAGCAACRSLAADLGRIRNAAKHLGPIVPPEQVWEDVQMKIRGGRGAASGPPLETQRYAAVWPFLGMAAALLIVTSAVYLARGGRPSVVDRIVPPAATATVAPAGADSSSTVADAARELDAAFDHYQRAIADLNALRKSGGPSADPAVDAAIDRNLDEIDRAIAESRLALAANPESASARDSLFDALHQKIGVLETTVALVNEMRQGNDDGAARAAENMGKQS